LSASVREVDFVGWYREGHVAAAALAQGTKMIDGRAAALIGDRMVVELRKRLSASDSRNLRVRVVRLGGRAGM
jgi:predicted signal transduction protein with EAL and GGDEF domain